MSTCQSQENVQM